MVIGLAVGALRGLASSGLGRGVAAGLGKLAPGAGGGVGGTIAGVGTYVVGGELLKNVVANPILRTTGLGQPAYQAHPAPPMAAAAAPLGAGGVTQRQQDFMYGEQPGMPFGVGYLPWQQQTGFMDRQLQQQERIAQGWQGTYQQGQEQATTRSRIASGQSRYLGELNRDVAMRGYGAQEAIAGMGNQTQRYLSDNAARLGQIGYDTQRNIAGMGYDTQRDVARMGYSTQRQIADMTTSRQLQGLQNTNMTQLGLAGITSRTQLGLADRQLSGLQDTNRTQVALADRQLVGVYDTNRRDVSIAGIGANRDRYLADRQVEIARWGGSMPRIAMFGQLMRR